MEIKAESDGLILVVEDNLSCCENIKAILQPKHEIIIVNTGAAAFEQITILGAKIDVILLDLDLPDLNGAAILDYVVNMEINTEVIICTTSESSKTVMHCLDSGAFYYILKSAMENLPLLVKHAVIIKRAKHKHTCHLRR